MLSPADAALATRDPALPGLATLLDPEAFVAALRTALPEEADIGAARATYVRYKPKTNCLVAYRLEVAKTEIEIHAKAFRTDADTEFRNTHQYLAVPSRLGPGSVVLEDLATVVYAFPNDYELRALIRLADESARFHLLTKIFSKHADFRDATLNGLRYKPARRYVAQLATKAGQQALLKVYARGEYAAANYAIKAFKSHGPLQLPRRLGRSGRHRILVLEWLFGQSLHEALCDPLFEVGVVGSVGAALAELHAQEPKRLMHLSREAEAVPLLSAAVGVAAVCPHLADRAYTLATRLALGLLNAPRLNCPIHGDFSTDQVLLANGNVAIVDLDHAVRGDSAADLGSFVAQLECNALIGNFSPDQVEVLTRELFEGYRLQAPQGLPARIDLYIAAGLLRLAPHPFRNREPDWPDLTEAILARAEVVLNGILYDK